jgi:Zinc carboxypeptidase/Putative metal-binding motif
MNSIKIIAFFVLTLLPMGEVFGSEDIKSDIYKEGAIFEGLISPEAKSDGWWNSKGGKEILSRFNRPYKGVVSRSGLKMRVMGTLEDYLQLQKDGFVWERVKSPRTDLKASNSYTPWASIGSILVDIQQNNTDISKLSVIGYTKQGLPIYALEISNGDGVSKPVIRVTSAHHGNEVISVENVLGIIDYLLSEDGSFYRDKFKFWIVPVVNPEGHRDNTRYNGSGYDLNRDYGFGWEEGQSSAPFSQLETRALFHLSRRINAVLGLDYHSVATYVNTVFDYTPFPAEDEELILQLGELYADIASLVVVVGYDWYQATGSAQDFLYGFLGGFGYTIETDQPSSPSSIVEENVPAFFEMLTGILPHIVCGEIVDINDSTPLYARLSIDGNERPFFSGKDGNFCRIFPLGTSTVSIYSQGYSMGSIEVTVPHEQIIQVQLDTSDNIPSPISIIAAGDSDRDGDFNIENWPRYALVLGDNKSYTLGKNGFITFDLGFPVADNEGVEFEIIHRNPDTDEESYSVLFSQYPFGPWSTAGEFTGNSEVDLMDAELTWARYIKIVDSGLGASNSYPGVDLDGILIQGDAAWNIDEDGDGVDLRGDCNDSDEFIGEGIEELCDKIDNNCDGLYDENFSFTQSGSIDCPTDGGVDVEDTGEDSTPDSTTDTGEDPKDPGGCKCNSSGTKIPFPKTILIFIALMILIRKFHYAQ